MNNNLVQHLIELRKRLLKSVYITALIFVVLFYYSAHLFTLLALPLLNHLPQGQTLIATNVAAPLLTPLKLSIYLSLFIAIPYILYQLWSFVAPALYQQEKRLMWLAFISSVMLFYLGMAFAYFVVFPLVFGFFIHVAPQGISVMPDISQYLDFTLKLFFAFGVAFEVPVLTVLLIWSGVTTAEGLAKQRPYVIVMAFTVGMLLTPPDVISQVLLALPMCLLFELGLFFARFYKPQQQNVLT